MSEINSFTQLTCGIDLGTSAVKVLLLDAAGRTVAEAEARYPTLSEVPQQAEQDTDDWLGALAAAFRALKERVSACLEGGWPGRVRSIALTGQLPTLVCLGDGRPLARAITWRDGRADLYASARLDAPRRASMYAHTGMPIDGRYLAPMFKFHFAERHDTQRLLSAKDYLLYVLTGTEATEPSTAAGYGLYDLFEQRFSQSLCEFWGIGNRLLPTIVASNSQVAELNAAGAALLGLAPGVPVSSGAADSVCASYAMSGLDPAVASISLGSSAVVIGATRTVRLDKEARYLLTPHVQAGWYGREMDLLASGSGYRWLSELFDWQDGELDRRAARSVPGARGLVFPPYLAGGEQGALWNPTLRAGLFGLGLEHASQDIARAYLEGVCFELRRCIEVLAEQDPVQRVMVSGNITRSAESAQLLADVLNRPVGIVEERSPAAFGAALLAWRMVADAQQPTPALGARRSVTPDVTIARRYDALYEDYRERAARCAR
jgi:sugar (pentulose or hexulose) kinase